MGIKTTEDLRRINAIIEGATNLTEEHQEYILATIRGMIFTKNCQIRKMKKQQQKGA